MKTLLSVLLAAWALVASAQGDVQAILNDTQKIRQEGSRMTIVWWIPNEFWEASAANDPSSSKEQVRRLIGIVDRYLVFAVVDGDIHPLAGVKARPVAELAAGMHVITPGGVKLTPLPDSQWSQELRSFFQIMRPMLANILGQFGKALDFAVFEGRRPDGRRTVEPAAEGRLLVTMSNEKHEWRLPLGSLLPPQFDPRTGERFPGNYRFNPFTGERLRAK